MYFSKKNKNYMFETLSSVIQSETGIQITSSQKYINIYRIHYPSIFETIDTDELSILNKEIINRIGNIILEDMKAFDMKAKHDKPMNEDISMKLTQYLSDKPLDAKDPPAKEVSLYSSQRDINSFNRYKFSLNIDFIRFWPKTITLLKEQNSLFSNPNINILFNDTDNILFTLKDTNILGDFEYYTYECISNDIVDVPKSASPSPGPSPGPSHSLKIQIRNYLMNDPLDKKDLYLIRKIKSINYENKEYLCLAIDDHDIIVGEELGLLSDSKQKVSLFVKHLFQNYILTTLAKLDLTKEYECLQMNKNITLTGLCETGL